MLKVVLAEETLIVACFCPLKEEEVVPADVDVRGSDRVALTKAVGLAAACCCCSPASPVCATPLSATAAEEASQEVRAVLAALLICSLVGNK